MAESVESTPSAGFVKKGGKKPVAPTPQELITKHLRDQCSWSSEQIASVGVPGWRYRILGSVLLLPPLPADVEPSTLNHIIEAYLFALPKVNCIVAMEGKINGELREPKVIVLTPDRPTETIHIENGIKFKVRDVMSFRCVWQLTEGVWSRSWM
jgi:tRNA G37 N-methylase Trm5